MKAPVRGWPRRLRRLYLVAGALVALGIGWFLANRDRVRHFPGILPGGTAKELCNCVFVSNQSESFCRDFTRYFVAMDRVHVDHAGRVVEAVWLGTAARARFEGERFGCRLE